jgi:hypothetical protein
MVLKIKKKNIGLKGCQIIGLPGAPTCLGLVLLTPYDNKNLKSAIEIIGKKQQKITLVHAFLTRNGGSSHICNNL